MHLLTVSLVLSYPFLPPLSLLPSLFYPLSSTLSWPPPRFSQAPLPPFTSPLPEPWCPPSDPALAPAPDPAPLSSAFCEEEEEEEEEEAAVEELLLLLLLLLLSPFSPFSFSPF